LAAADEIIDPKMLYEKKMDIAERLKDIVIWVPDKKKQMTAKLREKMCDD